MKRALTELAAMSHDEVVKTASVEQFHHGSTLFKERQTIVVKDGERTVGYFHPLPEPDESIPVEERRRNFLSNAAELRRELAERGVTEDQVEKDIAGLFGHDRR